MLLRSGTVLHTAASNVNLLVLSKLVADQGADLARRPSGDDGAQRGITDGAVTTSTSPQRGGDAWQHRVRRCCCKEAAKTSLHALDAQSSRWRLDMFGARTMRGHGCGFAQSCIR